MPKKCSQYDLTTELSRKYSHMTYLASPVNPQTGHGEPERQVVLTLFASSLFRFPHEREHLLQKARRLKELQHPHLVSILDTGTAEGQPFVVREYLPQGSLRSRLKKLSPEQLELGEALSIIAQVGEALLYAHQHTIVHGNIKPENILLNANGQALLTDFSLVERKDAIIRDQTAEEYAFCYLAPEQFAGTCDSRSDQYALGCLAYELMSGRVPFAAQSLSSMMERQSDVVPAPLSASGADVPPSLEAAVLKTLAKDPEERFFDFSLFLEVIQAVLSPPPAFPLARSANASRKKTISHPIPSVPTESIHKHASKRAASELAEASAPSLSAQDEIAEPAGAHPIVDASTSEQTETISQTELLTSTLQSQLFISSLSLDSDPLSKTDHASPGHSLQGQKDSGASDVMESAQEDAQSQGMPWQKDSEASDVMEGAMPLSQALTAQSDMDPPLIIEEEQDDMWLINPFVEEDPPSLGATASFADEQDEMPTSNMVSSSISSADRLGLMTIPIQRQKRKVLRLVLLLSVIVAVTTAGLWLSGLVPFSTNSYLVPVTRNNSQANLRAVPTTMPLDIPNIRTQAFPTVSATANSNPSAENAGDTLIGTNSNNYQSNTTNAGSNSNAATRGSSPSSTTSTANADPYPPSGTLALSDPLSDNSRGYGWQETSSPSSNGGSACQFIGGAYHAIETQQNVFASCHTTLQASNFTLEVHMQILQGTCGGLVLRDTMNVAHAYSFQVCQNGSYQLYRFDGFSSGQTLQSGSSSAIHTGLSQSNVIAAVANGSTFDLYVNQQMIASVNDNSYSQGQFGVSANGNSEAAYTNARMWRL